MTLDEQADRWELKARRTTEPALVALWTGRAERLRDRADIDAKLADLSPAMPI